LQTTFFCQAEDGIRDRNVTGVQTCALPILPSPFLATEHLRLPYYISVPFARGNQRPGSDISMCQLLFGMVATEFPPYVHRLRLRSEERRVGRECRVGSRWYQYDETALNRRE